MKPECANVTAGSESDQDMTESISVMSFDENVSPMKRRLFLAACLLLMAILCHQLSSIPFPQLDERAKVYFTEAAQKATVSYAIVRSANAVVSVIQESELELGVTGVGVSLAVGQVLDPLNDMLERTSTILVTALVSIGVQRAALEISGELALQGAALIFLLAIVPLLMGNLGKTPLRWLIHGALILTLIRLAMPLSALLYDQSYQHLFKAQIDQAQKTLAIIPSAQQFALNHALKTQKPAQGLIENLIPDSLRQQASDAEEKIKWLKESFEITMQHASSIIDALIQLVSTYVTMFLLQVIILPLIAMWLIYTVSGRFSLWLVNQL